MALLVVQTKVTIPKLKNDRSKRSYKRFNVERLIWSLFLLFGCLQMAFSQEQAPKKKNIVFIEGFGPGAYYSLNYGRQIFIKNNYRLFTRVGISSYHLRDFKNDVNPDMIIPLGLQLNIGKQHQLITGFGNTCSSIITAEGQQFEAKRDWKNHAYLLLGYGFYRTNSPYFFNITYAPLIERYQTFRHWAALSVGRSF